jgi:elongation factor P--(R)-beta-lysine ligase
MSNPADPACAADWRPGIGRAQLESRATAFAAIRAFFAARGALEVDTPQLVRHAVTDPNLHSAAVHDSHGARTGYLHTSPEYSMKRLLAAGSGDIWQLCHVFRGDEEGPLHNPEFMMLEWYRVGWSMAQLMAEVDALLRRLHGAPLPPAAQVSYEQAFARHMGVGALDDSDARLAECARDHGCDARLVGRCTRDELLDLMMGLVIGPRLGREGPVFLHGYPASQAALARLDPRDPRTALRFELYLGGVELANGFEELADAREQRARFAADQAVRAQRGLPVPAMDGFLLGALGAGMPDCAGVAMGIDRVLMLAAGGERLDAVLPFRSRGA